MQHTTDYSTDESPSIDAVFFAQTHVQRPDDPLFRLVADRSALIKVHVISATGATAPSVSATLTSRPREMPSGG